MADHGVLDLPHLLAHTREHPSQVSIVDAQGETLRGQQLGQGGAGERRHPLPGRGLLDLRRFGDKVVDAAGGQQRL
jgi:hypothetical protein